MYATPGEPVHLVSRASVFQGLAARLPTAARWALIGTSILFANPDSAPSPPGSSAAATASSTALYGILDGNAGVLDENAPPAPASADSTGSETERAALASPLLRDAAAVVAGSFQGVDTAALMAGIRAKAQWGELSDRLVEAEGILLWNRGDWRAAMICLRRVPKPGPLASGLLAEGLLRRGDRWEAAAQFLKAARAYPPEDARSQDLYRKYLGIKPGDAAVEAELATRLEKHGSRSEAARLHLKDPKRAAADPATALRVGGMLAAEGHADQARSLYRTAIALHTGDKALRLALAAACEAADRRLEAGRAFADVWDLDPADPAPRDRAIAHFEASGPAAQAPLGELLAKAVAADSLNHRLRFKLAVARLAAKDRQGAYGHLSAALRESPGNPTYLSRLADAIEGDSLLVAHFPHIRSEFEQRGGSVRLVELAAMGYALTGLPAEACRAWFQLHRLAPQKLQGRRDAVLSLAACDDPAYLSLAGRLAEPMAAAAPGDGDLARVLLKAQIQDGEHDKAARTARQMLKAFPQDGGEVLAAAKAMLSMERAGPAKDLLLDLFRSAPSPEVSLLLGGILQGEKDCPSAVDHLEVAADSFPVAFWMLGECLESLNDPLRASLAFQTYFSKTGDKESLLAMARVHRALGDPSREKETLEALLTKGLGGDGERLRLGFVHAALGDSAKAAALFSELFRNRAAISAPAGTAWADAGLSLGARLAAEGRHDRAIRILTLALQADSTRPAGWRLLGDCQAARRQWKPAFAAFERAEAAGGSSPELARNMVEAARKLGGKKETARAYASLVRHGSGHAEAHAWLAAYHRGERNYLDAAFHFGRLAEIHPGDPKAWENLGNSLALVPDLASAGEALQKALDLGVEADEVYVNRARAYRHEGVKDMAASIMEFLLSRNPRNHLALIWSAKFAEEDGHPEIAIELFKKAARLPPPRTAWPELASQGVTSAAR